ncbi:Ig heavy chain Mem5-like [Numida meleagris]|uniref:Ig heavy chain Mem5-like n=1 Tax=Numida meleagris TaxID=8996 RepID=UPI000B3D80D8|nr:Ig heavy chain Mem5-like [Numida meleagris]
MAVRGSGRHVQGDAAGREPERGGSRAVRGPGPNPRAGLRVHQSSAQSLRVPGRRAPPLTTALIRAPPRALPRPLLRRRGCGATGTGRVGRSGAERWAVPRQDPRRGVRSAAPFCSCPPPGQTAAARQGRMAGGLGPWLLALALGPAGVCAQLTLEASGGGVRAPGEVVQLSCRGSGFNFGNYVVLWYRQALSGHLEWLSYISSSSYSIRYSPEVQGRATVSRDNSQGLSFLSLNALRPQDSAHYFCALCQEWGVGVRTDKLVFGSGTTLTVEPSSQRDSVPEVIVMKSKKLKEDGGTAKAACLARNFYEKKISLEMSSNEVVYEPKAPIVTSNGMYNTIKVVNVTKKTEVTCTARLSNGNFTANSTSPEMKAEEIKPANICNTTDTSAEGIKMEKVNMLSMAVLGLRVLLAKSIAFNTVMSIKLILF